MQDYLKIQQNIKIGIKPISNEVKRQHTVVGNDFDQILKSKLQQNNLKISQHAQKRMNMRNIKLTDEQKKKLYYAVDKARQKGVKESLILMKDLAFVVSIKNNTVITAIDGESIKENVFTNIDGAVII